MSNGLRKNFVTTHKVEKVSDKNGNVTEKVTHHTVLYLTPKSQ